MRLISRCWCCCPHCCRDPRLERGGARRPPDRGRQEWQRGDRPDAVAAACAGERGRGRRFDGTALGGSARPSRARADAHSRRRAGQHEEPLRHHAARPGRGQRQRGRRRCAAEGRRGRQRRRRRWRYRADARGPHGQAGAGARAARSRCRRERARSVARRDRADVGGRRESRRGRLAPRVSWRRPQRAFEGPRVPEGQGRCGDDGVHGAASRGIDRADAGGSTGSWRRCARACRCRRRSRRGGPRRDDGAEHRGDQRALRRGRVARREGRESEHR